MEIQIDPNSYTVTQTSRSGVSRGGKTGAERKRDSQKNVTPVTEEIEKDRQKDRDSKKTKRGEGVSG